ncbi:FHA domain-containing protein, partial [Candidatus Hakubella thermalkaliphila]
MAKFCRTQWCQNYNKELSDDQVEFSPDRGVYYCKQCLMEVEMTADTGKRRSTPTSAGIQEEPTILRPIVRPPPAPVQPQEPTRREEAQPCIEIKGTLSFPTLELWYEREKLGEIDVEGDKFLIGRPSTSRDIHPDLDLSHLAEAKHISREHALIYQDEGNYFLK